MLNPTMCNLSLISLLWFSWAGFTDIRWTIFFNILVSSIFLATKHKSLCLMAVICFVIALRMLIYLRSANKRNLYIYAWHESKFECLLYFICLCFICFIWEKLILKELTHLCCVANYRRNKEKKLEGKMYDSDFSFHAFF